MAKVLKYEKDAGVSSAESEQSQSSRPDASRNLLTLLLPGLSLAPAFHPQGAGAGAGAGLCSSLIFAKRSARRCKSQVMDEESMDDKTESSQPFQQLFDSWGILIDSVNRGESSQQSLANALAGEYDGEAVRSALNILISASPAVMFTKESCPSCKKAIAAFKLAGAIVRDVPLDDEDGPPRRAELGKMVRASDTPFIFIGGRYVGGFDDGDGSKAPGISDLAFAGKLAPMLEEAGALRAK